MGIKAYVSTACRVLFIRAALSVTHRLLLVSACAVESGPGNNYSIPNNNVHMMARTLDLSDAIKCTGKGQK